MESVRTSVSDGTRDYPIEGTCDPHFLPVLDTFKKNFADNHETGVCVSVIHQGKPVVDLWADSRTVLARRGSATPSST